MEIAINAHACIGSGQCTMLAPGVFTRRTDGTADVELANPSEAHRRRARRAADLCPERAIIVT